jgi:hypothetical protein
VARRSFLAALAALCATVLGIAPAVAYTTRQLIRACRRWLKRHHVEGWDTVEIIPGDGPPKPAYLAQYDDSGNWRWAPHLSAWVGPAYNVSWSASATIPTFASPFTGQHVQLYVGDWTVEGRPALVDPVYAAERGSLGVIDAIAPPLPSKNAVAPSSGSGVAFVVQAQSADRQNLVPDPSFEAGVSEWSGTGGTVSQEDGNTLGSGPADGAYIMRVDSTGGGVVAALKMPFSFVGATGIPVVGGGRYRVFAEMFARSTDTYTVPPNLGVVWYTSSGFMIGGGTVATTTLTDAWEAVAGYVTAPPSAAWMQPTANADSAGTIAFGVDLVWAIRTDNPPADPTAPLAALDVRTMLGPNVTVGSTFTYPPEDVDGVGVDGDYYLDKPGKALYGPKDDGNWPADPAVEGFKLTQLIR